MIKPRCEVMINNNDIAELVAILTLFYDRGGVK